MSDSRRAAAGEEAGRQKEPVPPRLVRREVRDFVRAQELRRRQLPRVLLVGLFTGLVAVAFRGVLDVVEPYRDAFLASIQRYGFAVICVPVAVAGTGAALAVWLVRTFAPETSGSGIPHVKAVLHDLKPMRWLRVLAVKFASGTLGIAAGLALGREGPTIQMGAAIGEMVSRVFPVTPRERRTLVAAGAGAGLSAAFNAPLAGLVFVLEELQRDFAPAVFSMALFASVVADVTTRSMLGQLPVFHFTSTSLPPLSALPVSVAVGAVAGVLGIAFNRTLIAALDLFARVPSAWRRGLAAGAFVGLVGWFAPTALGGGNRLTEATLAGNVDVRLVPVFFVLRFFLTMASYGCGAAGGIFAPLLVLGAQIGLFVGAAAHALVPTVVDHVPTFAVVGMAAYFSAIVRAPLTGIVLMVEMTGNYSLVLPLLVASLVAYGIADLIGDRPIYEALLQRDLLREPGSPTLDGALLLDLTVEPGSPFDGKRVRELGLPPGCIVVLVRRGLGDVVPRADMQLDAGDQLNVVVDREAATALPLLERGVRRHT